MLDKEAKRQGYVLSQLVNKDWIDTILRKYGYHSVDDLYSSVGYGGLTTNQVLGRLIDEYKKANAKTEGQSIQTIEAKSPVRERTSPENGVKVKGVENVLVRFARCCNPVPGDPIIGYITKGRGVSVHRADCINLSDQSVEVSRLIEVAWVSEQKASYNAEIQIIARDRQAILADITNAMADLKINVAGINARTAKNKLAIINLVLEIHDTQQLEKVMRFFRKIRDVLDVFRVNA